MKNIINSESINSLPNACIEVCKYSGPDCDQELKKLIDSKKYGEIFEHISKLFSSYQHGNDQHILEYICYNENICVLKYLNEKGVVFNCHDLCKSTLLVYILNNIDLLRELGKTFLNTKIIVDSSLCYLLSGINELFEDDYVNGAKYLMEIVEFWLKHNKLVVRHTNNFKNINFTNSCIKSINLKINNLSKNYN